MELQFSLFSVSTISLIIFLLLLSKLFKRSKPDNLPPGPAKLPIIGNLLQLARVDPIPHRGLLELAQKYGPLMHLQLGKISTIVASSPRVAKEVLKTHDVSCADRPDMLLGRIMLKNSRDIVLAPYGDYWRQMRKISTSELLSANKVRSFRNIREEESWQLVESVRASLGSPVNFSTQVTGMANAVICRAAIGKKCAYQDELIEVVEDIAYWGSGFFMADLFPYLKFLEYVTGMRPKLEKMRRKLDHIFDNIIQDHKDKMVSKKEGKVNDNEEEDLIDVLLRINESRTLEIPITSKDIQGITLDMFTAGTDSTAATLQWIMSELMRNPQVMKKAQAEVRDAFKGKTIIHEADVQGLSYLKLVIKETLRLHAPVPLLVPRECRKQCEIDGYTIPVGTKIMVNAWAIGRDPEYWVDAESFIPERFGSASVDYIGANFEYIPFGAGRRICAGIAFAAATLELPMAQLLYYFDWKLPNDMKPEDLDMEETNGATATRKNSLILIPTLHTPSQGLE
uniref:Cytochrome P450 CYP71D444 n=1 Tax=Kalopanax septemlobus TaxID=228393 RepID=A0A0S2IHE4_KALSE|nr:cytochrome P450 CYP71D444 [Kalopanax septemlobus]